MDTSLESALLAPPQLAAAQVASTFLVFLSRASGYLARERHLEASPRLQHSPDANIGADQRGAAREADAHLYVIAEGDEIGVHRVALLARRIGADLGLDIERGSTDTTFLCIGAVDCEQRQQQHQAWEKRPRRRSSKAVRTPADIAATDSLGHVPSHPLCDEGNGRVPALPVGDDGNLSTVTLGRPPGLNFFFAPPEQPERLLAIHQTTLTLWCAGVCASLRQSAPLLCRLL